MLRAECADCPWSATGESLVDVSDDADEHELKEVGHDVRIERAATDGGTDFDGRAMGSHDASGGGDMDRVTVRMPDALLTAVDAAIERGVYPNRSEALRAAIRQQFVVPDGAGSPSPWVATCRDCGFHKPIHEGTLCKTVRELALLTATGHESNTDHDVLAIPLAVDEADVEHVLVPPSPTRTRKACHLPAQPGSTDTQCNGGQSIEREKLPMAIADLDPDWRLCKYCDPYYELERVTDQSDLHATLDQADPDAVPDGGQPVGHSPDEEPPDTPSDRDQHTAPTDATGDSDVDDTDEECQPGDTVVVTNIDGETTAGTVADVCDETVDERAAPFLDAEDATLADYWRGTDVAPDERVIRVDLGNGPYDYPASRVEPVAAGISDADIVEIPFNDWSWERLQAGRKHATARTDVYGSRGDVFLEAGTLYELTHVVQLPLAVIAEHFYHQEGCDSPTDFIEVWEDIHPGRGFEPEWKVWLHLFREVHQDA
jgi:hypothetical protein